MSSHFHPGSQETKTHWSNPVARVRAMTELGKLGLTLNEANDATRSEMLESRGVLRSALNACKQRAEGLVAEGKMNEAEDLLSVMATFGSMIERAQTHLDNMSLADAKAAGRGSRIDRGDDVRALAPADRMASLSMMNSAGQERFGFGEYVRAMVLGSDKPDIRASLSEGTDSAGGYTVPLRLMGQVIDAMRAQTVVVQAGAMTIPLDTQKTSIARLASDPTAGWRLENGAVAESDPTFEKVEFTVRSLAVLVKVSRELLEDSVNLNEALVNAFARSMAVEVDRVALFGTGTAPQPRGIFNTSGIGAVDMAVNGAALANWGKVLDAVLELKLANAPEPTAMVMAPRTWRTIAGFADTTGQPLRPPVAVESVPRLVSTIVPITQTQGSASNASPIITGDFTQLLLGVRTDLRIEVLRERFAENHQYAFVAHLRMDVQLARPKAFSVLKGIIP